MEKLPKQDNNKDEEEHKAILERVKSDNSQPPFVPYSRMADKGDGIIEITYYD